MTFDEEENEAGNGDEQRHQADVDPLEPYFEPIDAPSQIAAHLLELLAFLGLLFLEVCELLLLFRREDELLRTAGIRLL